VEGSAVVFGKALEYDFLAGWIKYNRMLRGVSQEALAYGICSTSHLSYFENGRKSLRSEIIEALLKKLKIDSITEVESMGLIRQSFHDLMLQIEGFDYEYAEVTYSRLLEHEPLIQTSPYSMEFTVYRLVYRILVERMSLAELSPSVQALDKVYGSLHRDLQYAYLLSTGKLIYDSGDHEEGLARLRNACGLKETPWIHYRLGVEYCNNHEPFKAIYYLEKALRAYESDGRYRNALSCHSFLGKCHMELGAFEKAEAHLKAVLAGSDYFHVEKNVFGIYTAFADLYLAMGRYEDSAEWSRQAMNHPDGANEAGSAAARWSRAAWNLPEQPVLGACLYVEACIRLGRTADCRTVFEKYLDEGYKDSRYYPYLSCLHTGIYHAGTTEFYREAAGTALPYYRGLGYLNIVNKLQWMLIEYLEKNRRYKEANRIYKELLQQSHVHINNRL